MKVIHRYVLNGKEATAMMPATAKILPVIGASSTGGANIYAEVDPNADCEPRLFNIVKTGEEWDETKWLYLGTFTHPGSPAAHVLIEVPVTADKTIFLPSKPNP